MRFEYTNGFGELLDKPILAEFTNPHTGERWVVTLDRMDCPIMVRRGEGIVCFGN